MKIAICSDLHLEFGSLELKNPGDVDVLILSGDILVENDLDIYDRRQDEMGFLRGKSKQYHEFFHMVCSEFKDIIYVAGNHEHYHGDYKTTIQELKRKLGHYKNLHVLDKESIVIDDTLFFGGTLWTDMNKEDPLTLDHIRHFMNDFRIVKNSSRYTYRTVPLYKKDDAGNLIMEMNDKGLKNYVQIGTKKKEEPSTFSPQDAVDDHKQMISALTETLKETSSKKVVVVGHHAPSKLSTHPRYAHEYHTNGGYSSDLSEFILDNPLIKLWTHGHTHEVFDYMLGATRVVCNPRGYIGYEDRADKFTLKVVEV